MASIEFVNHSSYVLEHGSVRLICDPWLDGAAFDSGWDLLAKTQFPYEQFQNITHLWFSHEHPDHFSPPNLKSIPKDARAGITVLFQSTSDHKVAQFCRSLGFAKVIELKPGEWLDLGGETKVLCEPHDNGDSWLAIHAGSTCVLNLNDCVITTEKECASVLAKVGPVDVLMTQFSYANWVGNPGDTESMKKAAAEKLSWVKTQIISLKPRYVVPFASFVYFSHEDNAFLNEGMIRIDAACRFIDSVTKAGAVVLYPGDRWNLIDTPPSRDHALTQYKADHDRVAAAGFKHRSKQVSMEDLLERGNTFAGNLRSRNGPLIRLFPSVSIFIEDHSQAVVLSPGSVRLAALSRSACDLACKSDALNFCFAFLWGGRTLDINGRFQVPQGGRYWKFKLYATLANFNNRGEGLTDVLAVAFHRFSKKLRRS